MSNSTVGNAAIAVVRRNTRKYKGKGNWAGLQPLRLPPTAARPRMILEYLGIADR